MATTVDEQAIIDSLRQVPVERWVEVLDYLDSLREVGPQIHTMADLLGSELVGMWADRDDLGDGREFARMLRNQAEPLEIPIPDGKYSAR